MKYYVMAIFTTTALADPVVTQYKTKDAAEAAFYSKVGSSISDSTITEFTITFFDQYQNQLGKKHWAAESTAE